MHDLAFYLNLIIVRHLSLQIPLLGKLERNTIIPQESFVATGSVAPWDFRRYKIIKDISKSMLKKFVMLGNQEVVALGQVVLPKHTFQVSSSSIVISTTFTSILSNVQ